MKSSSWQLITFGTCALRTPEGVLVEGVSKKGLALLAYLACAPQRRASRDRLAALLWEQADAPQSRLNLRKCISLIRRAASASGSALPLQADSEFLSLPGEHWQCDLDLLAPRPQGGECQAQRLLSLISAYTGDFLVDLNLKDSDEFEIWARVERQRLRCLFVSTVAMLLDDATIDHDIRLRSALRLTAVEPLDEPAHRRAMRLLWERGQAAAAIEQYRELERRLRDELEAVPDQETRALAQEIKRRRNSLANARSTPPSVPETVQTDKPRRSLRTALAAAAAALALTAGTLTSLALARGHGTAYTASVGGTNSPLLTAAVSHLESGDPARVRTAAMLLRQMRTENPRNVDAQVRYAEAMVFLGNRRLVPFDTARQESVDAVEQAIAVAPDSADAYLAKGMVNQFLLWQYGTDLNRRVALASLSKAVELRPDAKTYAAYGIALSRSDHFAQAAQVLEKAVALDSRNLEAQSQLALSLAATGSEDAALRRLEMVDHLYPNSLAAKQAAAWILIDHGEVRKALPLLVAADRADTNAIGKAWLYTAYVNLGDRPHALEVLHSMRGDDAPFAHVLQLILDRRYSAALDQAEAELARTDDPMWVMACIEFATMLHRDDLALRYVQRGAPDLLSATPVVGRLDVAMALSAAQSLNRLSRRDQAQRIVRAALAGPLSTSHYVIPSDYVWRSAAYAVLGDRNRALSEFEEAYRRGYRLLVHRDNFMAIEDYPMFDSVRSDPRFRNILRRIAEDNRGAAGVALNPDMIQVSENYPRSGLYKRG